MRGRRNFNVGRTRSGCGDGSDCLNVDRGVDVATAASCNGSADVNDANDKSLDFVSLFTAVDVGPVTTAGARDANVRAENVGAYRRLAVNKEEGKSESDVWVERDWLWRCWPRVIDGERAEASGSGVLLASTGMVLETDWLLMLNLLRRIS